MPKNYYSGVYNDRDSLQHWKYIRKYRKNGRWQYVYYNGKNGSIYRSTNKSARDPEGKKWSAYSDIENGGKVLRVTEDSKKLFDKVSESDKYVTYEKGTISKLLNDEYYRARLVKKGKNFVTGMLRKTTTFLDNAL